MSLINQMLRDLEARIPKAPAGGAPLQGLSERAAPGNTRQKLIFGLMLATLTGAGVMMAFDPQMQRSLQSALRAAGVSQPEPVAATPNTPPAPTPTPTPTAQAPQTARATPGSTPQGTTPAAPRQTPASPPTGATQPSPQRPAERATPATSNEPPYIPPLPTYRLASFDLVRHKLRTRLVLGLDGAAPYRVLRNDGQGLIVELERTSGADPLPTPDLTNTPLAAVEWSRDEGRLLLRIDFREGMAENRLFSLPTDRDGGTRIIIDLFQPAPPEPKAEVALREQRDLCVSAINLARMEKLEEAEIALGDCLRARPREAKARAVLAALLINGGRLSEAQPLIASGLRLNPGEAELARIQARLLINGGAVEEALRTLRAVPAPSAEDHAFVAALEQRANRHQAALAAYGLALKEEAHRGVWWLGSAISLEASGRPDEARDAYRRAGFDPRLPSAARDYAIERLEALAGAR